MPLEVKDIVPGLPPLAPGDYSVSISPKRIVVKRMGKPRKQPKAGDTKLVRGKVHVRRQQWSNHYKGYLVSRGKPLWEWRREDLHKADVARGEYPG